MQADGLRDKGAWRGKPVGKGFTIEWQVIFPGARLSREAYGFRKKNSLTVLHPPAESEDMVVVVSKGPMVDIAELRMKVLGAGILECGEQIIVSAGARPTQEVPFASIDLNVLPWYSDPDRPHPPGPARLVFGADVDGVFSFWDLRARVAARSVYLGPPDQP
jgi:hypothetical protein